MPGLKWPPTAWKGAGLGAVPVFSLPCSGAFMWLSSPHHCLLCPWGGCPWFWEGINAVCNEHVLRTHFWQVEALRACV